jgi:hypothetical protein
MTKIYVGDESISNKVNEEIFLKKVEKQRLVVLNDLKRKRNSMKKKTENKSDFKNIKRKNG